MTDITWQRLFNIKKAVHDAYGETIVYRIHDEDILGYSPLEYIYRIMIEKHYSEYWVYVWGEEDTDWHMVNRIKDWDEINDITI